MFKLVVNLNWEVIKIYINDCYYESVILNISIDLNSDTMPEMIYRFIEQNVRPGPHISLKCSARGSPPPQVILMIYVFKMFLFIFVS